jgi:hypothetical protein
MPEKTFPPSRGWLLAIPPHDQTVAVVLDLVNPVGAGGRLRGTRGDAGVDEAVSANNEHVRQIACPMDMPGR